MFYSKKIVYSLMMLVILSMLLFSTVAFSSTDEGSDVAGSYSSNDEQDVYQTRLSILLPQAFYDWYDENYASKSTQKALYLALGGNGGWAVGSATGYSTLATAKSYALTKCNEARATYNISESCELYAENNNVVYLNDLTNTTVTTPTLSSSLEINIPTIIYQSIFGSTMDLWLILEYSHSSNGEFFWKLKSFGENN